MIKHVLVLGSGSAGLLAGLAFKRKLPQAEVRIVRSPEIGTIGVGEGTTPLFPGFLFDYLGISRKRFYAHAQPTWKIGARFLWGPRRYFDYGFDHQVDLQWGDLPMPNGFYCEDDFTCADFPTSLMEFGKVFARQPNGGGPEIEDFFGFHIENAKLVDALESAAKARGVEFIDGKVSSAERGPEGVTAVHLEDGQRLEADFFIDASGFRSELLGKTLEEPFVSYADSLFCDRAIVGGWERTDEPILPYTTAETMDGGWSWQIEHEHHVNRGYVFSSAFLSDDDARVEFLRRNPKAPADARVVKFRSGRRQRMWVDNVAAVGNAAGFVEPLEASALMMACIQLRVLIDLLLGSNLEPTAGMHDLYNRYVETAWDEIRDFLAVHYKFNTRLATPFWRHCQEDTNVDNIAPLLDFYRENGPSGFARHLLRATSTNYGIEGFLVHLVGNQAPHRKTYTPTEVERRTWEKHRQVHAAKAKTGMTIKEALVYVRHPKWTWHGDK